MTDLEQLAHLLSDAVVNLDPKEFDAIAGAAGRFRSEGSLYGCPEFATLFGAIERVVLVADSTSPVRNAYAVAERTDRRNIQNRGRRCSDIPLISATS